MVTIVSEMGVYHFFRDTMKFVDNDAKKYARFAISIERKLNSGIRDFITNELQMKNFATKEDLLMTKTDLQQSMGELRSELKSEMGELRSELKSEMSELRSELKTEMGELRSEMGELRSELKSEMGELKHEMSEFKLTITHSMSELENKVDKKFLHFEAKMEKSLKEVVVLVVTLMTAVIGTAVAVMKLL